MEDHGTISDGFGNTWALCSEDCELAIVRPGKVQCVPCDTQQDATFLADALAAGACPRCSTTSQAVHHLICDRDPAYVTNVIEAHFLARSTGYTGVVWQAFAHGALAALDWRQGTSLRIHPDGSLSTTPSVTAHQLVAGHFKAKNPTYIGIDWDEVATQILTALGWESGVQLDITPVGTLEAVTLTV